MPHNVILLIHTHSSYSYLWPIIQNHIATVDLYKILAHNSKNIDLVPNNFDEYIYYDDSINYARRMTNILKQINSEYVFLVYDVDIMVYFDIHAFNNYFHLIYNNNIDRLCCATFNGRDQINYNGYSICNLNKPLLSLSNHFVPADCSPVIWKKVAFIQLLEYFPNESYASLELNKNVITYCKNNVTCYGIQYTSNVNIKYVRGLTYNDKLGFLHITTKGKFTMPDTVYMDMKDLFLNILQKYNLDVNKIGYHESSHVLRSFKRLVIK